MRPTPLYACLLAGLLTTPLLGQTPPVTTGAPTGSPSLVAGRYEPGTMIVTPGANGQPVCRKTYDSFCKRLWKAYWEKEEENGDGCNGNGEQKNGDENGEKKDDEPKRRGLPAPFPSPPFPSSDYIMVYPVGIPVNTEVFPLMKAIYDGPYGEAIKESRIKLYGWVDMSYTASTSKQSNLPDAFNIRANEFLVQQFIVRLERVPDTVQTDHIDWGFKIDNLYGVDYRYTTARGISADQLIKHNHLYGEDPVQFFGQVYLPHIGEGTLIRFGRFILLPGIEADLAVDNYMFSHSILYTYFPYTHMGVMATTKLSDQLQIQYGLTGGSDIALWDKDAELTPITGIRWVSADNNDSIYFCTITNSAKFTYNNVQMLPDVVWTHRFSEAVHMLTEAYYCFQKEVPQFSVQTGTGANHHSETDDGYVYWYGISNYFEVMLNKKMYFTIRNEAVNDVQGQRTGFKTWYSTHTLGLVYKPNDWLIYRPELKFSHSYDTEAYDQIGSRDLTGTGLGTSKNQFTATFDVIFRF